MRSEIKIKRNRKIDPCFTKKIIDILEKTYRTEKKLAKPVTRAWIKKIHLTK